MAEAIYILCAITSIICALLLMKSYRENRSRLLFWSGLCFAGLALNNIFLVIDLMVIDSIDLSLLRSYFALAAISILTFGLVWESR